jgi:hypothetical protein
MMVGRRRGRRRRRRRRRRFECWHSATMAGCQCRDKYSNTKRKQNLDLYVVVIEIHPATISTIAADH